MEITRIAERIARAADPSDEQLRLLVSSITDYAIYLLDTAGRVASWNAGAERIKGYRAAEIVGRHFSLFYPPEERAAGTPERALAAAAREGRFEGEGWRVCKDGSRFWA
ncbi:MAG TPA: PAS domain S-box protein, partial [Burkholderiales bacterium]|nr:PAS domain S-box protein [Burkholderiales bacterium]